MPQKRLSALLLLHRARFLLLLQDPPVAGIYHSPQIQMRLCNRQRQALPRRGQAWTRRRRRQQPMAGRWWIKTATGERSTLRRTQKAL